uniref:Immunoglobulin I-set domain-containing protein n=1 Tax=Branchiostoma floridae TaxID=7739 RepID=C3XYT1_BRAFL|eukprot:XP_002610956.1 hypothetical protein BRAFLDRAFT_96317 [Branchiostoma floridae]
MAFSCRRSSPVEFCGVAVNEGVQARLLRLVQLSLKRKPEFSPVRVSSRSASSSSLRLRGGTSASNLARIASSRRGASPRTALTTSNKFCPTRVASPRRTGGAGALIVSPIPTLSWRRVDAQGNVVAMPPAARLTMENFNRALTITDIEEADAGFYEVTATNSLGTRSQRTQLIVNTPSYVRHIRLTESGSNYAVLSWVVPQGFDSDDIGGYQVRAIPKSGGDTRTIDVGSTETTARIDGLNGVSGGYTYQRPASVKGPGHPPHQAASLYK